MGGGWPQGRSQKDLAAKTTTETKEERQANIQLTRAARTIEIVAQLLINVATSPNRPTTDKPNPKIPKNP